MKESISLIFEEPDKLSQEVYSFWYYRGILWLDDYKKQSRLTTRHKYQTIDNYNRIMKRRESTLTQIEVPLTPQIEKLAVEKFIKGLEVKLWKD
jgi:hypothetical protein